MIIEDFRGAWSPVAHEIAGIQTQGRYTTGTLVLVQDPDFHTSILDTTHMDSVWHNLTWSPDGKRILYSVVPETQKEAFLIDMLSDLWMVNRNQGNSKPAKFTGQRAPGFWGWMDDQTVVFTTYNGGGHEGITEWNYATGKILADDLLSVYSLGELSATYAPVKGCDPTCTTYVVLRDPKPDLTSKPCGIACRSKEFPRDPVTFTEHVEIFFQDWLPGSNKMLLAAWGWEEQGIGRTRLILWDVDSDQVTSVMAGGIFGRYSSDGKYLAWATYGPASQYARNVSGPVRLDPFKASDQIYLQVLNQETRQTILNLPAFGYTMEQASTDGFFDPLFTFSPDNQWITLVTPGRVQPDANGRPVIEAGSQDWSFNIINLKTRQLVKSIEIHGEFDFAHFRPVWSPQSNQFVYQDESGEWQLFDVRTAALTPLTQEKGEQVSSPAWSFDGRYLQMISESLYFDCADRSCFSRTYIFDLSGGK